MSVGWGIGGVDSELFLPSGERARVVRKLGRLREVSVARLRACAAPAETALVPACALPWLYKGARLIEIHSTCWEMRAGVQVKELWALITLGSNAQVKNATLLEPQESGCSSLLHFFLFFTVEK